MPAKKKTEKEKAEAKRKKDKEALAKKRAEIKAASDKKIEAAEKRVKAEKVFKVHMMPEDVESAFKSRPKLVKAKTKKEVIEKAGKGAYQAFECGEKYALPKEKK